MRELKFEIIWEVHSKYKEEIPNTIPDEEVGAWVENYLNDLDGIDGPEDWQAVHSESWFQDLRRDKVTGSRDPDPNQQVLL